MFQWCGKKHMMTSAHSIVCMLLYIFSFVWCIPNYRKFRWKYLILSYIPIYPTGSQPVVRGPQVILGTVKSGSWGFGKTSCILLSECSPTGHWSVDYSCDGLLFGLWTHPRSVERTMYSHCLPLSCQKPPHGLPNIIVSFVFRGVLHVVHNRTLISTCALSLQILRWKNYKVSTCLLGSSHWCSGGNTVGFLFFYFNEFYLTSDF